LLAVYENPKPYKYGGRRRRSAEAEIRRYQRQRNCTEAAPDRRAALHLRQLRQYLDAGFLAERRSSVMQSKLRLSSQPGGFVD
jgi:hypothetical protein